MRLQTLEIQGFRAFGADPQRLELGPGLTVIWAANSQGKSSIAEAIEFLLTGTVSRKALHGGAQAKFEACLRNVHLGDEVPVYVQATVTDGEGIDHTVRRTLLEDFTRNRDCISRLEVDGQVTDDLGLLGAPVGNPPLQAPVMMQHSLRYVLTAAPKDRLVYLKAVLDITDLEVMREQIAALRSLLDPPDTHILALLAECQQQDSLAANLASLATEAPTRQHVEQSLMRTMATAMFPRTITAGAPTLAAVRATFLDELASRRSATFPLDDLDLGHDLPDEPAFRDELLERYTQSASAMNSTAASLRTVFQAVLNLPDVSTTIAVLDCPVCETPEALTPERVGAMREFVHTAAAMLAIGETASGALASFDRDLLRLDVALSDLGPGALTWDSARQEDLAGVAAGLLTDESLQWHTVSNSLTALRTAIETCRRDVHAARRTISMANEAIDRHQGVDHAAITAALAAVHQSRRAVVSAASSYRTETTVLREALRDPIEARSDTATWEQLATLAAASGELLTDLRQQHARTVVRRELDAALKQIDTAKARVLDQKLEAMSRDIRAWWDRLRPDEPIWFGGLDRRGQGLRYVDLKARMSTTPDGEGPERHAAAVLSDSQLNALGLSTFLARCLKEGHRFVVFDDPVPASDEEHRSTFCVYVIAALLDDYGQQVVITTHDTNLDRNIRDRHAHREVKGYVLLIDDPVEGAAIETTSDTFEAMLEHARPLIRNRHSDIRADGATRLRRAAERFCKDALVVMKRAQGTDCSITEFEEPLGLLIDAFVPYIDDPSHIGKLRTLGRTLNPGAHDQPVPDATTLGVAVGDLKYLRKQYPPPS